MKKNYTFQTEFEIDHRMFVPGMVRGTYFENRGTERIFLMESAETAPGLPSSYMIAYGIELPAGKFVELPQEMDLTVHDEGQPNARLFVGSEDDPLEWKYNSSIKPPKWHAGNDPLKVISQVQHHFGSIPTSQVNGYGMVRQMSDEPPPFRGPKCECGLTKARAGGKHSSWCPIYKNNEEKL